MSNTPTIPLQFTYPKSEHLKSRKAIEQLFKTGQSFFVYPYKVVYQVVGVPFAGTQSISEEGHPQGVPLQTAQNTNDEAASNGHSTIHYPLSIVHYYPVLQFLLKTSNGQLTGIASNGWVVKPTGCTSRH